MTILFLLCCVSVAMVAAEEDGWAWKDGDEAKNQKPSSRYDVNENLEDFDNERPLIGFRPQNTGPYGPNSRPIVPASYPGNKGVLVGPGGPTGIIERPSYVESIDEGALNGGFLPSWVKDDPRYREYDVCRCRYSFNCPSVGLKFGSCSKDKKYCCFNSKKYPALVSGQYGGGGSYPPYLGIPNKNEPGTFGRPPNYYGNRRPHVGFTAGNRYPGNYHFPGENPNPYPRPHRNPFEQNYDYNDYDLYSRSLRKNQTEDASTDEKA
ncbi:unnamed protein product [Xylocopa violacea]|uniref:Uncharacterized protein n=1 Tax=Xylocopa violacea TaxID=135666 RepID=A0ABP1NG02_XYLVO